MVTVAFTAPRKFKFPMGILSWGIQKFTKSKVSHCLIGTEIHGMPVFLHCTGGGVKVSRRDTCLKEDKLVHEFEIKGDMAEPMAHAWTHIDDDYDYAGIFGFAWVIIFWRWFKRKVRNPVASPNTMWCSEFMLHLTTHGEHEGRIPEWKDLSPEYTHCQHLIDRIKPGEGSFGEDLVKKAT